MQFVGIRNIQQSIRNLHHHMRFVMLWSRGNSNCWSSHPKQYVYSTSPHNHNLTQTKTKLRDKLLLIFDCLSTIESEILSTSLSSKYVVMHSPCVWISFFFRLCSIYNVWTYVWSALEHVSLNTLYNVHQSYVCSVTFSSVPNLYWCSASSQMNGPFNHSYNAAQPTIDNGNNWWARGKTNSGEEKFCEISQCGGLTTF